MKTSASKRLYSRACKTLVGGVNSPVRAFRAVGAIPLFISSARGSTLRDADGNSYTDYVLSWGPMILGHSHPQVVRCVQQQARKGSSYGACSEMEIALAESISSGFPSMQLLRLTSSGTEAVMSALRLARAYTRRNKILKFIGGYHGHVDSLLVQTGSGGMTLGVPDSAGVPPRWAEDTLLARYNDEESARTLFKEHGEEIAAVIVEPAAANMGVVLPKPGFLQFLRQVTKENKSLLVFDEVVTGFRLCYGGAQTLCGISPDLTVLGKIIGGGFPVGAYGGRKEIMELVSPLGPVYQAGTLSGNPVAMAAGAKTLEILKKTDPYKKLENSTRTLTAAIEETASEKGVPVRINRTASMFTVFFTGNPVSDDSSAKTSDVKAYARFFQKLLENGVYFPPAQFEACFLSSAHSSADLEKTAAAVKKSL